MNLWELYRGESNATICMVGIIILAVKLCEADGHFSDIEKDEIFKVLPCHSSSEERSIFKVLDLASKDKNTIEYHAERVKKYIRGNDINQLEFVIAVLYKLAHSDHIYDEREDVVIRKVADIFQINKSFLDKFSKIGLNNA